MLPMRRHPPCSAQASLGVRSVRLGLQLMQELFDAHSEARPEVLRVCQAQLASGRLEAALPFVLLLGNIGRQQPQLLAEHGQRLKDCLQNFSVLSPEAAQVGEGCRTACLQVCGLLSLEAAQAWVWGEGLPAELRRAAGRGCIGGSVRGIRGRGSGGVSACVCLPAGCLPTPGGALRALQALLAALWPLCQRMRALQDYVILVMRKIMFARDVNSRCVRACFGGGRHRGAGGGT